MLFCFLAITFVFSLFQMAQQTLPESEAQQLRFITRLHRSKIKCLGRYQLCRFSHFHGILTEFLSLEITLHHRVMSSHTQAIVRDLGILLCNLKQILELYRINSLTK